MTATAGGFSLSEVEVALPRGASARTHRKLLRHQGRPLFGLTQGRFRACLHPVFSPAGFLLTSESPADHPHHNAIWAAADHVHAHVPAAEGRMETYTYNFYVDDVFQGRAPGRILDVGVSMETMSPGAARLIQHLEWRGPAEWGAPDGRHVLHETRIADVRVEADRTVIDLTSELRVPQWDVSIGPTRHAFFNMRLCESIAAAPVIASDLGPVDGRSSILTHAAWIDMRGPVGGGHAGGIAMRPHPDDHPGLSWFVTDWGIVTAQPRIGEPLTIRRGQSTRLRCRYLLHDAIKDVGAALADPSP